MRQATENMLVDGSSQGMGDGSSVEMPNIGDSVTDVGKGTEVNGTTTDSDKTTKKIPDDRSAEPRLNEEKKIIVVDENDDNCDYAKKRFQDELNPNMNGRNEKAPQIGMVFTSYEELINYFRKYALRVGFRVTIKNSAFIKTGVCRYLALVCSRYGKEETVAMYRARRASTSAKTNCQVMISAKLQGDGFLHLVEANLEHNHPINPSTKKFMRCYKSRVNTMAVGCIEQPNEHNNMQLVQKRCRKAIGNGRLKLAEGGDKVIHQFFACMQNKDPNFFYLVDLDQHGRLRNLFWADATSRAANRYFGDVVTFDTTYLTDKYDLPLVSFVGVNHHGQLVLLGCGLVSDETTETYLWLFKSWLTCMLGRPPNAIITDQCRSIQQAVAQVFPEAKHRLCLSRILKKIPDQLGGLAEFKAIKKAFKKTAYDSLRVDEFEENWKKMIEAYGLEGNRWLKTLYDDQHSWSPVFLKDNTFWAGMSISRRGEGATAFFDGCVYPRTSIKKFFRKWDMTLQNKSMEEAQADFESFHKTPLIVSKFYMEEQLSKIYSLNMFTRFQHELKATMYCHVTPITVNGSIFTFEIKECSYIEDGKKTESKDHEVLYNADELVVQCICGFFHFHGILCRHSLSVLKFHQVFEIPSRYILDRWKKDFKQLHALACSSSDVLVCNPSERYNYLAMRFLQLVDLGFISEDRYQLSLKLIRELEKYLLDGTSGKDGQVKLLSFETHSNQNVQNLLLSQLKVCQGNMSPNSIPVKRRGRPPKRGRESNVESLVQANKEQDFLISSLIANEDNVLQAPSTVLNLDAHKGRGGINAMGQYERQTIGNQARMHWIYQQMLQEDRIPKGSSACGTR